MTTRPKKPTPARKRATEEPFDRVDTACHNIIRLKKTEKASRGWKVNLKRRGKYMHKYFTDEKYGGKAKALQAAKTYRDSLMAVTSDADYALWRKNKMPSTNTSGIVGVARYAVWYKYKRKRLPLWQAVWDDIEGKRHCRRFFVSSNGERQAKKLAIKARLEAMEELRQELIRRGAIYGA
jgi:hypothetical protein